MIITALLFLTLISTSQTQTAPIVMRAAVGETITVGCLQGERYKGNSAIWWCRTTSGTRCNHISSIDGHKVRNDYRGTSIANTNGKISVTIRHLQEIETGAYCCGLEDTGSFNISDVILLKVFTGTWEPIVSEISGVVGNVATVPCLYTEEENYYKKFLCKVTSINKCTIIASSDGAVTNLQNGSVSITINNSHNFAVTLGNINKADEGEYWCGAVTVKNIKIVQVKHLTTAEGRPNGSNDTSREVLLKIWTIFRWLLFAALAVCSASVTFYEHFAKGPVLQASK
ncbi:polymeric immunoglobulin receptor-like isoform X2 [Scyliorhinus canicula]|uniref:polymeric immunoglobulin receptor-like isoform X2 n=1 Tax=Scyliorhinus canicula TaxID=7830 RepID=UPI0018F5E5DB|nr:polymeric immunoglobulin receptor-like isoform X2 [Scyliorhinus canicula]